MKKKYDPGFMDKSEKTLEFLKSLDSSIESPVSVLFTGKTSKSAWHIRGNQIAALRNNWIATNNPTEEEIENSDIVCIVKKPDYKLLAKLNKMKKPFVYDIIDCWKQPDDDIRISNKNESRIFFSQFFSNINADGYIFADKYMEKDLSSLVARSSTIYHHYWPQIKVNPIREEVKVIGYDGADFLGEWDNILKRICAKKNVEFITSPLNHEEIDIVILTRGGDHASYLSQKYKSNVKMANAYGSGTPAIVNTNEISAHEVDRGDILFFYDEETLEMQIDLLLNSYDKRKRIHSNFLSESKKYSLEASVNQFEAFFKYILDELNYTNEK